jgi:hypothetical protein
MHNLLLTSVPLLTSNEESLGLLVISGLIRTVHCHVCCWTSIHLKMLMHNMTSANAW